MAIIDDCQNQIHFSERFFYTHLISLESEIQNGMNLLNKNIYNQFNASITAIDIKSNLGHLTDLSLAINSSTIRNKLEQMKNDLKEIETLFNNITVSMPTLPNNIVNQTIDDVRISKL